MNRGALGWWRPGKAGNRYRVRVSMWCMTEDELISFVRRLPGGVAMTAGPESGAPEVAWGDTFFFADPEGDVPGDRRFPFGTLVTKDYEGFDTASKLDRPGVFRLNIGVGRRIFEDLFGYPPADHAAHRSEYDFAAEDQLIPHPVYAVQGWASVVSPGPATDARARELLVQAHERAARRHGSGR
jgi:hypothetical protein